MAAARQMAQNPALPPIPSSPRGGNNVRDIDALRSTFIRNVSHEFRTPLGIILGYAELLRDGDLGALAPEQEWALSTLLTQIHELRKIVEWISILMAVETNALVPAPLNLSRVVSRVVDRRRAEAERSGIELVTDLGQDLPSVSGDPCHLTQMVDCLVENALKFTPDGGRVEVEVRAEPGWVCLVVTDTGIGIPAEELGRIFAGFYQVDGSLARQYGGLGLGLTLVKAVAEQHGGWVEVESQPGQGSRFRVRLPTRCAAPQGGMVGWINAARRWSAGGTVKYRRGYRKVR